MRTIQSPIPARSHPVHRQTTDVLSDLGELPRTYGLNSIFLMAQEPHWLFTYWDIDISQHPGGQTFLRVSSGDDVESEQEVPFETRNWYIPVKKADEQYSVDIGYYRGNTWHQIAQSDTIRTPKNRMSESDGFSFATIPLHLSFHQLFSAHERPQNSSRNDKLALGALFGKHALEELSHGTTNHEQLSSHIQTLLQTRGGGSGEMLPRGEWSPSDKALFSAISALAATNSWDTALSSWERSITSWAEAARAHWENENGGGQNSELNSSLGALFFSWTQAATGESSWRGLALTSWMESLSSWTSDETTSWTSSM